MADQLIAETRITDNISKNKLDKQAILKTLNLIERVYNRKTKKPDINIEVLYSKPIIMSSCLTCIDLCKGVAPIVNPAGATQTTDPGKTTTATDNTKPVEDDCGCGKIPPKDDCECVVDDTCISQNPCCVQIVPYIADLFVVKEEVSCYQPGEMSYIENVLQTEIRERTQRSFQREEIDIEHEVETTSFEEKDQQVDERFSLQKEIDKTVDETLSVDAGVTAHQKWGTGDVTATTNVGYNMSKKDGQKLTQDNAKEVITKSISSLQTKIRDLTSRKLIKENEEINRHVFGGTTGAPNDISRQFFYVNQLKMAQVYNYGRRSLIDFYLPEPSELYKRLIEKKFTQKQPEKPCITIGDISPDKYLTYVKCYGLTDVEFPPETQKKVIISFKGGTGHEKRNWLLQWVGSGSGSDDGPKDFAVPDGYVTDSMQTNFAGVNTDLNGITPVSITLTLANVSLYYGTNPAVPAISLPALEGSQSVSVSHVNIRDYTLDLVVNFKLKPETLLKWQLPIYYKIMDAYQKDLADYNANLAEFERTKQAIYQQDPFLLLQDIQDQLKQAAISYISCQFFDDMDAMKNKVKPCGFPQMDIQEAKKEGEYVRFFEQAFEWKFMNFIFYPYFWSRKCTWESKMNEQADNMLFQRFLKAGYARVSVSIRQGFEGHVNYFLCTRKIWDKTGIPPVMGPDFVPIFQEIKEDKDNFNTDREGKIDVVNNSNQITLTGTNQYWDTLASPPAIDDDKIAADIDREIFINCKRYRIVAITELLPVTDHQSWVITLDRPYEGANATNLPWSTGALFVGAPWEFAIPTRLVWLREKGGCLPCYPIKCEDKL
jgi:hypothetical protein